MWRFLANKILRNRLTFIIILTLITFFMGYKASKIQLSYEFAKVLPDDDSTLIDYENFKKMFGEDGSVMVIGFQDKNLFQLEKFNDWYSLSSEIKNINGIKDVMSAGNLYNVIRNDSLNKFDFTSVIKGVLHSQKELDSVAGIIHSLPFYEGLIYNNETGATLMAITFTKKDLNTKHRIEIVNEIKLKSEVFAKKHNMQLHYSGMPYIRTAIMQKVSHEMGLFLALAVLVMAIILWIFFRSFTTVFFSIIIVAIGVIWSLGTIDIFNYKITILSGLIPPLIMVIGIPNCVFLINKYHSEFSKHGNKIKSLARMMETIGITLFLANITTAIGFGVLYFTNSSLLVEFGVIAAINVMATYLITLILVPIILSFLPVPTLKQTKHLDATRINKILTFVDHLVHNNRKAVYLGITIITIISLFGMSKINVIGFVVDDLPKKDPIYTDLKFFEKNFNGVLPFEISVDTKKQNGVFSDNGKNLYKIKRLQKVFAEYPEFSKPLSVIEGIKFSYQAYKDGNPKFYVLPGATELIDLSQYNSTVKGQENKLQKFIDSSKQYTRISIQMADVGSQRTKELVKEIKPKIDSIFDPKDYNVKLTGHSLMFLKGNDYLLKNLIESLLIEILLIALVGVALFRSVRIILLSKLPCLIPLIITAGIMGYLGIRFKPSTILIFSIAFGISSDGTIYFLTRYRHELKKNKHSVPEAISITIRETGIGMIYTAVILFAGFAIFAASSFGGTVAMGVLISITLLVAMLTNLVLLPALLLSINKRISKKEMLQKPFIEIDEEEEKGFINNIQ
ncbi:MAG: patched family protein [Bacteroidetes bacterium RIFCSPLOWO2_12_FULL_35_15]|nr:MAG: patched family protein [Bacteroidetes bacterium RIFCSPLOWO2_12_FULL_35_15]